MALEKHVLVRRRQGPQQLSPASFVMAAAQSLRAKKKPAPAPARPAALSIDLLLVVIMPKAPAIKVIRIAGGSNLIRER